MNQVQAFDYSVDILRNLLWQYNSAPNLEQLLTEKQNFYNVEQTQFWEDWYTDVFDIRTANSFGLSVWTLILGVPLLNDTTVSPDDYPAFGFSTSPLPTPVVAFDQGNFATGANTFANLTTEEQRILLQIRYFILTSNGSVTDINQFLANLVGPNIVYAIDNLNMTMTYVLTITPPDNLLNTAERFDLVPHPSAVGFMRTFVDVDNWGFGQFHRNFDRGNFYTGGGTDTTQFTSTIGGDR